MRSEIGVQLQTGSEWRWIVTEGPRQEVYLTPSQVASKFEELARTRMPYSLGLFMGGIQGGRLHVSLEAASYHAPAIPESKLVLVADEAEQPILYGRDVLAGSIRRINDDLPKADTVVIANNSKEILALGMLLMDAGRVGSLDAKHRCIKTLIDKGWYLRRGG